MLKKLFALVLMLGVAASSVFAGGRLINGAGATFPYPIYSKWFDVYQTIDPSVRFNYQSIGSGGGVKQISAMTVDFGASDGPMTAEEMKGAEGGQIFHIPTVIGSVVPTYNIPGVGKGLKLSADIVSDIFLGKITKWNDPRLMNLNPDLSLPDMPLAVAHRSDGSGTTYIWTDYLANVSADWRAKVGTGKSVNWPVGLGGKGNEGVAGLIKQTPGCIGYVELAYAEQNNLEIAAVQNKAGNFIQPSKEATSEAAVAYVKDMPKDFRVSIVNGDAPGAYPIAGFTWILVYKNQKDAVKGKALVEFLRWAITDGQKYATELGYGTLPADMVPRVQEKLSQIVIKE